MKIVVIGGSGLIGSKVVRKLREQGHDAIPASRKTGVNTLTGDGLTEVLRGADVVVDVSDSPSFEEAAVMDFFRTSTTNLLAAEEAAGVRHHVALSVVGTDRRTDSGYMRAKIAQEKLDDLVRRYLAASSDRRSVIADPHARYFGGELEERTLVPNKNATLGQTTFEGWLGEHDFR